MCGLRLNSYESYKSRRWGDCTFARASPVSLSRKRLSLDIEATPKTDLISFGSLVHHHTWRLTGNYLGGGWFFSAGRRSLPITHVLYMFKRQEQNSIMVIAALSDTTTIFERNRYNLQQYETLMWVCYSSNTWNNYDGNQHLPLRCCDNISYPNTRKRVAPAIIAELTSRDRMSRFPTTMALSRAVLTQQ